MNVNLIISILLIHAGRLLLCRDKRDERAPWFVPERAIPLGIDPFTTASLALPDDLGPITAEYLAVGEYVRPGYSVHLLRFFARVEIPDAMPDLSVLASVAEVRWADADEARQLLGKRYDELPDPFPRDRPTSSLPVMSVIGETVPGYEPMSLAKTRVSARIAAHDVQGRLLLVKSRSRDSWVMPGGHYERGETIAQCAERETHEEAGVQTIAGPLYWLHAGHDTGRDVLVLEFVFSGAVVGEHPAAFTANDEGGSLRQVRLFTPDELAALPNVYPESLRNLSTQATAPTDAYRVFDGSAP